MIFQKHGIENFFLLMNVEKSLEVLDTTQFEEMKSIVCMKKGVKKETYKMMRTK